MVISGASPEGVAIPELGVAPPDDSGMDLQDELLTPEASMVIGGANPEGIVIPELSAESPDDSGTDLEDELFNISPLPPIVTPLTEHDETLPVSPSLYPEPPVPTQPDPVPSIESQVVQPWEAVERPTLDLFPSFVISPAQSCYDPATSPITPDLQDESGFLPPDSPATMDQYLAADGDLLLGDSSDLPLLSLPLLPIPVADVSGPVSAVPPSVGEPVLEPSRGTDLGIPKETGVFAWKVLSARKVLPARKARVCGRTCRRGRGFRNP